MAYPSLTKGLLCLLLAFAPILNAAEVRVAVAANFLATLKALVPLYEQQSGDRLLVSAGSSGKLYAQIINGAPYDVLLSADQHYPEKLIQQGKALAEPRFVYATGVLVLWSADETPLDETRLTEAEVKRIALANPATAPYGATAKQALDKMGLWQALEKKIVRGESVGQAFQFVASGNAQLGFIALSQVLNPRNRFNRRYYWTVPADFHAPLVQEAVLLEYGKKNAAARRFLEFLNSPAARDVISEYGYH